MAVALGTGALVTPKVQALVDALQKYMRENPLSYGLVVMFLFHQYLAERRQSKLAAVADKA